METFAQSVVNAHSNAAAPAAWIPSSADMFKVSTAGSVGANPYGLQYYNNQLIVRTASSENAYNGVYSGGPITTAGSNYTIFGNKDVMSAWVTTGKEMTGFIDGQGLTAGTFVKGVERGLGMNDKGNHDAIFEMAVTVSNTANPYMLRPTRNPDPTQFSTDPAKHGTNAAFPATAQAAGIGTGAAADAVFANYKKAYTDWMTANYPWTQLGYTYYWGQAANKPENLSEVQGMSEFILLGGAGGSDPLKTPSGTNESGNVVVVGIYASQSYIYTKNNGQYGNGFASFNVTGPCNTLWAGKAFQAGASLNPAALPNKITIAAGGAIAGGQGILVGSQNYEVTNAGSITANAGAKKFNVAGSENIALLFKGDTHAAPGTLKNTLINSGTITAPGANGTAVAAWAGDTVIINTGTITGTGYAIVTAAGKDKVVVTGGSVSGGTTAIETGTGKDKVVVKGGAISGGEYAIKTGSGNDKIKIKGGVVAGGEYAIHTGAGDDKLTVKGGEIIGKIDMGAGTDTFTVSGQKNATFNFTLNRDTPASPQVANAETVTIADGTIIAVRVAGATNIKNNDRFLIADATALTVDPTKLAINNDAIPMVNFSAGTSGNQLFLTALRDTAFYGQRVGNASLGFILDSLANTATGDMAFVLGALDSSGDPAGAKQMQPTVNNGPIQASFGTVSQYTNTVLNRIGQVVAARTEGIGMTGISTGDETAQSGVWAQGFGSYLHQGATGASQGYTADVWGISFGYDRHLFQNMIAGFSGAFARNNVTTNDVNTRTDADSYQGSLYGSLAKDAWYLDAIASFAYNRYDASRHIVFAGIDRTAKSDYGGYQYSGYFEGGYTFKASGLLLTPLVSVQAMRLNLDDYTETQAGALNLKVDRQRYNLFQTGVGAKVAYPVSKKNLKITPELHAKWLYDFAGDAQQATSTFTGGGASFVTTGFEPPRTSGNIGAKLTIMTESNWSVSLNYDFEMKQDFYSHNGWVNLRYEF
jgi:outer membrane autotransporter protein